MVGPLYYSILKAQKQRLLCCWLQCQTDTDGCGSFARNAAAAAAPIIIIHESMCNALYIVEYRDIAREACSSKRRRRIQARAILVI